MTVLIRTASGAVHHSQLATCLSHVCTDYTEPTVDTWWYVAVNGIRLYSCIASGPAVLCCSHVLCWGRRAAACRTCKTYPIGGTLRPPWCLHARYRRPQQQEAGEEQQKGIGREGQLFSLPSFFPQLWCCCAFVQAARAAELACLRISIALSLLSKVKLYHDRRTWARTARMRSTPPPPKTQTRATEACRYPSG